MTKSSLARVRWQVTLVEHEPTQTPGWKLVQDTRKLSDEVHEVELLLESPELQKADFEDFSKQEDKLKVSRRNNVTQRLFITLELILRDETKEQLSWKLWKSRNHSKYYCRQVLKSKQVCFSDLRRRNKSLLSSFSSFLSGLWKSNLFLQLISEKLEDLEPRATEVLSRSETVQSSCTEKEYDAVKKAASKFRLQWNNLNQVNMGEY